MDFEITATTKKTFLIEYDIPKAKKSRKTVRISYPKLLMTLVISIQFTSFIQINSSQC